MGWQAPETRRRLAFLLGAAVLLCGLGVALGRVSDAWRDHRVLSGYFGPRETVDAEIIRVDGCQVTLAVLADRPQGRPAWGPSTRPLPWRQMPVAGPGFGLGGCDLVVPSKWGISDWAARFARPNTWVAREDQRGGNRRIGYYDPIQGLAVFFWIDGRRL